MTAGGGQRGLRLAVASAALTVLAAGVIDVGVTQQHPPAPEPTAATSAPVDVPATPPAHPHHRQPRQPFGPVLTWSAPTGLAIPAIGIDLHDLVRLGRTSAGALEVPSSFDVAGWYDLGPAPGQLGAAVIAGHVDSTSGPAVFWRLGQLHRGDLVRVPRRDGSTATFRVYAVAQYPKDHFPTVAVYGNTSNRAELRLITCGGTFDAGTGHYRDNTVVFARLISHPAATA
ncbi:MAG TPA: class F sortase [Mycobacteriales bacterium]|nr:class F sortase [Mycobacteriales bacterium]